MATYFPGAHLRLASITPACHPGTPAVRRGLDPSTNRSHIINNNSKNSYRLNSTLHPQDAVKPRLLNHKPLS